MIFNNENKKQSTKIGVSFDENLEVYEFRKTHRPIKRHERRKKKLISPVNHNEIKNSQAAANSSSNTSNELEGTENSSGTFFSNGRETVGILIHDNEYTDSLHKAEEIKSNADDKAVKTESYTNDRLDNIKSNSDKPEQQNERKFVLGFKKQDDEFDLFTGKHAEQAKKKYAMGQNMEDILNMFVERAQDTSNTENQKNGYSQINATESTGKQDDGPKYLGRLLLQTVHYENKYDFLNYMAKEYGKMFEKDKSQHNLKTNLQTTSCKSNTGTLEEGLSDEENNHTAYCGDKSLRLQEQNEQNSISPVIMNTPKSPAQSVGKSGKNAKSDIGVRNLEFRREEAKRRSELDKVKFKKESTRSENLIPVKTGLFSDIIFFDENIKSIITDRVIDHAKNTGLLKLCNKSLTEVPDKVWSPNDTEVKLPLESTSEGPDKWRSVLNTIANLNLRFNKLNPISPVHASVCSIKELRLNNNRIDELPNEIGELRFLSYLNLSYNRLKILPPKLCCLKNLEEINLRRNFLESLPDTFGNLVNLRNTDLSFNKMTKLPTSFVCLGSLTYLDLSFNRLIQLPMRLMYLKKLEHADISYNYLSELPPLVDMRNLTFFDSTCNRLRHFPNFSGCIRLTELRLGVNQIKEIVMENLCRCPLVNFMLAHNKVEIIPDDISLLTRLEILDVSDNLILMLPWTLAKLQHLTYVKVDNNKIANVKKSALEDSPQSILEILRNRLILYEGKDSPILKQIAEKEKKEMKERKEWGIQEENIELMGKVNKKKKKRENKRTAKVEEEVEGDVWAEEVKRRNEEDNFQGLLDSVIKKLPDSNKMEFRKSLIAQRSLICKEMNLSDLSVNLIKVASHYKVFKVDLSKNNFSFVPTKLRDLLNHLRELILSNNNLKTIPDFLGSMIQLRKLDVHNNQLDSFPLSMCDCTIVTLNARDNCFTKIPKVLYSIYTLEHVNFSKNRIKTIDVYGIKNWKRLSYLNMRSNVIEEVPCELGFLMNIRTLDLCDNPFKDPSPQILKSGTINILKHLRYISFKRSNGDLKNMVLF